MRPDPDTTKSFKLRDQVGLSGSDGLQICTVCGEAKPATPENFYVRGNGQLRRDCKVCFRRAKAARDAADPAHRREIARNSYCATDGAAVKRRARERRPDLYRAIAELYEAANAEERHLRRIERHQANLEADREASRDWYHEHRERAIETALAWMRAHPDEARVQTQKTRLRRQQVPGAITAAELRAKIDEFEGRCGYCGELAEPLEVDHVVPVSRGGTHLVANVVPACRACNRSKGQKMLAEWQAQRTRRGEPVPRHPDEVLAAIRSADHADPA